MNVLYKNNRYEIIPKEIVLDEFYQQLIKDLKRFNGRLKYPTPTRTLHCWLKKEMKTILMYEKLQDGTIINRMAILL